MQKLSRNDPCHCGSGLKYKKCCLSKDEASNVIHLNNQQVQAESPSYLIDHRLHWDNEMHHLVARHFVNMTSQDYEADQIKHMIHLWHQFATGTQPVVKKAGAFTSALEQIMCHTYDYPLTQKQLAVKHQVSVATIAKRTRQIFDYTQDPNNQPAPVTSNARIMMEKQMAQLHRVLEQQNFQTMEEANSFIQQYMKNDQKNTAKKTTSKQDEAQELIYQAWDAPTPAQQVKLAQEALLRDPNQADAYNVLAFCEKTPKAALYLYKKGLQIAKDQLGQAFFEENKGHFWGILSSRPFMRAKQGYADMCLKMGNLSEAIQHYEEMLALNPNDNQGVRDMLLTAYLEAEAWNSAKDLVKVYNENSACFNYGQVIMAYESKDATTRLSAMIKEAVKQNPYVVPYLLGQKKTPRHMPEYIGIGDENEAIAYVIANHHLWVARPALLQLLPRHNK